MSAQRRTPANQQSSGSAAVAPRPAPAKPAGDKTQAAKSAPRSGGNDTKKGVEEARKNILATRTEGIRRLVRDSWSEMKKVNWPDRETTRNLTIVVIGISTVLGLLLGGVDYLLTKLLDVF
jgi:preprotein translocase subunit SecE